MEDEAARISRDSAWGAATAPPARPVRHSYPVAVHDPGVVTAFGLLMMSLPYALARFGILLGYAIACIVWLVIAIGGAAFLGNHLAGIFGVVWFVGCCLATGWFWGAVLRYGLHLLACGHVAVLTELIMHGELSNGDQSMLAYGKRIVTERFGEVNALFGLNLVVRGILGAFHRTLNWIDQLLPIPGLDGLTRVVNLILRAATRYLDKVILSYDLARGDGDPWRVAREGLVYYAQNAMPILKTAVWSVILEKALTVVLWLLLLMPAGLITWMMPGSVREQAGIVTVLVAALLAGPIRAAFIQPLFLIMMMVRFHAEIQNQPINQEWDDRLAAVSETFRDMGQKAVSHGGGFLSGLGIKI